MRNKNNFKIPVILLVILAFFVQPADVIGQKKTKKSKKKRPELAVEFNLSTTYDDNILKYSEKYLERFDRSEDQGRFHIATYDDVIFSPALKLSSTFRIFGKLRTKVNADFSQYLYLKNDVKNWNSMNVGIQQYVAKQASFKIFYSYIPDFYVRHFRDSDWVDVYGYIPETFQPYSFAKENLGFWAENTFFSSSRVRLSFNYAKYYHNEHFTEYDCNNLNYGINLYQTINKKLKIRLGYEFTASDAKGYDEASESKGNSDDSDASYDEDGYSVGCSWDLPFLRKLDPNFDAEIEYMKRYYTTKNFLELDQEHAGRVDDNMRLGLSYTMKLKKSLKLSVFYNYMFRNSDTRAIENKVYLSNEKDYRQAQIGLEIIYNFKL
ncbi:MAG: hypothetical protein HOO86_07380 [Bacteroidales bacterium]|nr:hypothetical protein [Bacteroidales bacterium]